MFGLQSWLWGTLLTLLNMLLRLERWSREGCRHHLRNCFVIVLKSFDGVKQTYAINPMPFHR